VYDCPSSTLPPLVVELEKRADGQWGTKEGGVGEEGFGLLGYLGNAGLRGHSMLVTPFNSAGLVADHEQAMPGLRINPEKRAAGVMVGYVIPGKGIRSWLECGPGTCGRGLGQHSLTRMC